MSKKDFDDICKVYSFDYYTDIVQDKSEQSVLNGPFATFDIKPHKKRTKSQYGYVYLWVEQETRADGSVVYHIVYVGEARDMAERCRDHVGGFRGKRDPGKRHNRNILKGIIEDNKRYSVYARLSNGITVLGEEGLSMRTVEEEGLSMRTVEEQALIRKYKPPWNTAMDKAGGR